MEAWDGSGVWKWCAWIKLEDSRASSGKWSVDWDIHSFTSACCFCSSWDGPSPQSPPPQSPPPSCAMYGRPKHTCFACGVSYERTAESGGYRTCVNEARSVQFWGSEEPREKEEGGMGRGGEMWIIIKDFAGMSAPFFSSPGPTPKQTGA